MRVLRASGTRRTTERISRNLSTFIYRVERDRKAMISELRVLTFQDSSVELTKAL